MAKANIDLKIEPDGAVFNLCGGCFLDLTKRTILPLYSLFDSSLLDSSIYDSWLFINCNVYLLIELHMDIYYFKIGFYIYLL